MIFARFLRFSLLTVLFFLEIAFTYSYQANVGYREDFKPSVRILKVPQKLDNSLSDAEEMAKFEKDVVRFMDVNRIVGASVAVVKDGQLVYSKGLGFADRESGIKATPQSLFRIASVSKLITATAIMRLVESDMLDLDDRAFGKKGILKDSVFIHARDNRVDDITVRQLLTHTAGWSTRRYGDPMFEPLDIARRMDVPAPASQEAINEFVMRQHLSYRPGSMYKYSNFGYVMLGKIIEELSGETYENYVKSQILNPLGIYDMTLTANYYSERVTQEVKYYDDAEVGLRPSCYGTGKMCSRTYEASNYASLGAAGGWIGSATDIMRLLVSIDGSDDKPDMLSANSVDAMTQAYSRNSLGPLGWKGVHGDNWWRTGTLIGTNAILMRRADGISYFMVTNTNNWQGPHFNTQMKVMLERALRRVGDWPEQDLLERYELLPESMVLAAAN